MRGSGRLAAAAFAPGIVRMPSRHAHIRAAPVEQRRQPPPVGPVPPITKRVLASLCAKLDAEPTATLAMLRLMLTHPGAATQVRDAGADH